MKVSLWDTMKQITANISSYNKNLYAPHFRNKSTQFRLLKTPFQL